MARGKFSGVSVRIEGSREAKASLRQAGADLGDLKSANAEIAGIIEPVASGSAPRGKTGKLARSGRQYSTKTEARVAFGNSRSVVYGRPIHWGWPAHHIRRQAFLWDAQVSTEPKWHAVYFRAVQAILDRIKGAPGNV